MKDKKIIKQLELEMSNSKGVDVLNNIKQAYYNDPGILKVQQNKRFKKQNAESNVKIHGHRKFFVFTSAFAAVAAIIVAVVFSGVLGGPNNHGSNTTAYTENLGYKLIENGDDSFYEVSLGQATDKDIVIPSKHENLPVKRVAKDGFMKSDIKSVIIPNSVTVIDGDGELEEGAFCGCQELVNIVISKNVTSIGDYTFFSCYNLTSVTFEIGSKLTYIGKSAFVYCNSLTSIAIPNGVTNIDNDAFGDCNSLTSIIIPSSVTNIGYNPFAFCGNLASITIETGNTVYKSEGNCIIRISDNMLIAGCNNSQISNSVESIYFEAFLGCSSLTSIIIPNSVTNIDWTAFKYCSGLTNIMVDVDNPVYKSEDNCIIRISDNTLILGCKNSVIPDNVMNIGYGAFYGCVNLTSITIPNKVKNIDNYAFYNCDLTSIIFELNSQLINIGDFAFTGCKLTNITIPNSVINIGDNAFWGCSLTDVIFASDSQLINIGNGAFYYCYNLTNIIIPGNVTSIGDSAFYCCMNLMSITIPNSVINIGNYAFWNCNSLINIIFESNSQLVNIGDFAFTSCKFKNITIPNSVISIGMCAFWNCESLTNVIFESNSKLMNIGDGAFSSCTNLASFIISSSVTSIGNGAFRDCDNLTIYTELASRPNGWDFYWNKSVYTDDQYYKPVVWGCTLSEDDNGIYVQSFTKLASSVDNQNSKVISVPYRKGYNFVEWNTNTDGSGTSYAAVDINSVINGTTLYTIWAIN